MVALLVGAVIWLSLNPEWSNKRVKTAGDKVLLDITKRDADRGIAEDQYRFGRLHAVGQGVETNHVEAAKWYRKAAEQNHAFAQRELGACYQDGTGVSKDLVEAYAWYDLAANMRAEGTGGAAYPDKLASLRSDMSKEQIEAGKRRAEQLRAEIEAKAKNGGK